MPRVILLSQFGWLARVFSGAFVAIFLVAANVQAETSGAFAGGEKSVARAAGAMERACRNGIGPGTEPREAPWHQSFALGGDNFGYVIEAAKLQCLYQSVCGTGGCQIRVISFVAGKARTIFDGQTIGWTYSRSADGVHVLKLERHGSECGKTGTQDCCQILDLLTGKITSPK